MKVKDLKNYGKGLLDSEPDLKMIEREGTTRMIIRQELEGEFGQAVTRELMSVVKKQTDQMKSQALSILSNRGLTDERFIESVIKRIALMKALSDVVGVEKASAIQCRLVEKTIWELMSPMWPSVEDYKSCGNFFEAFREYSKSTMAANVRAGLHYIEMVEDSPTALAYNVEYCVWHEIAKSFGNPYLCYPSTCYGDEVTIPRVLDKTGYRFRRAGTLAQGAQVCDFRYECLSQ
jgi:L-2-amino-thiazoline-4-carboxylic acid hydrolase